MALAIGLRFEGVSKTYLGAARAAVDAVSVDIPAGAFVALVGASGSGKTTLMKMANRLVEPDAGRVLLDGQPVAEADVVSLRRGIGYVFQGVGLFPHMSVAENIAITLRLLGETVEARRARVLELLDLVALPAAYADRMPNALSGGERQRVGVARALAAKPGLLLMDEPFGALDPVTRESLAVSTRALHDQLGLTTLMVTHDMQEALLLADRVLVMARGQLVAGETPAALLAGHADPDVVALVATPQRQAARLSALAAGAA